MKKIRVALAGLRFGGAFAPIYLHHPNVSHVGLVDPDSAQLNQVADRFDISRRHTDLSEVLNSNDYDAVHLITPIPLHAEQSIAVLNSGKHCACTVPMATSVSDLRAIVSAQRRSGKNYMMMETAVYTREYFMVREMLNRGELGRIQFVRGAHYQDMQNWPEYWKGLPPMWYATHAIAPCLALTGSRAREVRCFGSGRMPQELQEVYGNAFPIESAVFKLDQEQDEVAMEVTRTLFHTAREYQESFSVYGDRMSFEWPQRKDEEPLLFRLNPGGDGRGWEVTTQRQKAPDRADLLPPEIARFTQRGNYDDMNPQKAFETGGGHHGSHPHLVHEFVQSMVENRKPYVDEIKAADWTAAGLCAHKSASKNGEPITIPAFS